MNESTKTVIAVAAVGVGIGAVIAVIAKLSSSSTTSSSGSSSSPEAPFPITAVDPVDLGERAPILVDEAAAFEPVLVHAVRLPGQNIVVGPAQDTFVPGTPEADNGDLRVVEPDDGAFFDFLSF